ncbi:permease [Sphingopyxis bauzanensis]|uniref:Permease n=1 Tax=Sphingopyxis bauzanensis TaxID=651663 RepID=A0A246JJN4_9SPHN|nr:DMT family transporter [Sphingopyxis bauzanensis]OWQ92802.1 permease [Sphingopyxis bauzanensis]
MSTLVRRFSAWREVRAAVWSSPTLLLCLASFFWALNPIVGRAARDLISPLSLAFWRWVVAFLFVLPFAWRHIKNDRQTLRESWPGLVLLGFFGVGLFSYLVYSALQYTTATNSLMLQAIMPIMTMVIPAVVFGERLRPLLALGAGLSFAGVVWIVTKGHPFALQLSALNRGDLLAVTAVFLYSAYATFLRKAPAVHHLTLLAILFAIGAASLAIPYFTMLASKGLSLPPAEVVAAVLYVGIFPSLAAYGLFNRSVVLIGSVRAGVYMNLPTVFGVGLAIPLLGEYLSSYHFVGAIMIIAAIAISRR